MNTLRSGAAMLAASTFIGALAPNPALAVAHDGDATPPCTPFEIACDDFQEPKPGQEPQPAPACTCGPGYWESVVLRESLRPELPIEDTSMISAGTAVFRLTKSLEAVPGEARAMVAIQGESAWWDAGSHATAVFAAYSCQREEQWVGEGPPCPRLITPVATGSASLTIATSATARTGCTASTTATAMGSASSRGDASARLEGLSISGRAGYTSASDSVTIEGNFGPVVEVTGATYSGYFSSETSYEVEGTGSDSGSAGLVVSPDRTYCAWTNKPVRYTFEGRAAGVVSGSVDDNGSCAAVAESVISVVVN